MFLFVSFYLGSLRPQADANAGCKRVIERPNYDEDDKDEIMNIISDSVQSLKAFSWQGRRSS